MNHPDSAPRGWSLEAAPVELTAREAAAFTDRVMAAIALAPLPTPTRTFVAALRAGAARDAVAAVRVAWHLGTVRRWPVAPRVRARSFALVLAVASVLATGSLAAVAAVRVVVPQIEPAPATNPGGSGFDEHGPMMNHGAPAVEPRQTRDANPGPVQVDESDESDGSDGGDVDSGGGDESDDADEGGTSNGSDESDESDTNEDASDESDEPHSDEDDGSSGGDESDPDEDGGDESDEPDEGSDD